MVSLASFEYTSTSGPGNVPNFDAYWTLCGDTCRNRIVTGADIFLRVDSACSGQYHKFSKQTEFENRVAFYKRINAEKWVVVRQVACKCVTCEIADPMPLRAYPVHVDVIGSLTGDRLTQVTCSQTMTLKQFLESIRNVVGESRHTQILVTNINPKTIGSRRVLPLLGVTMEASLQSTKKRKARSSSSSADH